MTHDPRQFTNGGQEYAPPAAGPAVTPYSPPPVEEYAPQPVMRQAPAGYQPQPAPQTYAAAPGHAAAPAAYAPYVHVSAPPSAPAVPAPVDHLSAAAQSMRASLGAGTAATDPALVVLSRAYEAHDLSVQAVRFRKPTTKDLRKCGYPMRNALNVAGSAVGIDELPDVVAKYVTLLSDPPLPPSTVDQFELDDFSKCSAVILGFFLG